MNHENETKMTLSFRMMIVVELAAWIEQFVIIRLGDEESSMMAKRGCCRVDDAICYIAWIE
jgi:hypothetical protein